MNTRKGYKAKKITINNIEIIMEGIKKGNYERFSVMITKPLMGYHNLTEKRANFYYEKFIQLAKNN